ncbi:hypothetical protein PCANC_19590 [Puccinia coronata f. sp. avenae]|uniref:Uncharacterized protein n=1 Tax=Puccinia coronata f. sp. avenae TaxID=200324 RepID=A0A2N5URW4_9BASI|nr:hypothetical protein PCANC_19590 [Puccinia coronata f. sp. avenae]
MSQILSLTTQQIETLNASAAAFLPIPFSSTLDWINLRTSGFIIAFCLQSLCVNWSLI